MAPSEHSFCILECLFSAGLAEGGERQVIHSLPSRSFLSLGLKSKSRCHPKRDPYSALGWICRWCKGHKGGCFVGPWSLSTVFPGGERELTSIIDRQELRLQPAPEDYNRIEKTLTPHAVVVIVNAIMEHIAIMLWCWCGQTSTARQTEIYHLKSSASCNTQ